MDSDGDVAVASVADGQSGGHRQAGSGRRRPARRAELEKPFRPRTIVQGTCRSPLDLKSQTRGSRFTPFATRQLADLGARVIKIERPGEGDFARRYDTRVLGQSSYFAWINRSKESLFRS